ncbi:MAG: serine hydrolase domain-containing protein [Parvularculaceae bacterium]
MIATPPISGIAPAPFDGVRAAFELNFAEDLELGAHFSAVIDGELVVNLIGGYADREREKPWAEDTIACVFSSGKAAITLLVARAVSDGILDYGAPVADYWPEFAENGKEEITLADVMSHQAGLCGFSDEMPPEDWLDWEKICTRIAAIAPLWPPRSASGYSPQLFGFIVGEILRRTTGRGIAQMLREDFAAAGLSVYCGMGEAEIGRAAYMPKPPRAPDLGQLTELKRIAFLKPWSAPGKVAREAWMAAEIPSSNIHSDAIALAEIVQPLANGGFFRGKRIVSSAAIGEALAELIRGDDLVLPFHLSWTAGLMRNINGHFGPSATAFGHAGFGGSCAMVDPANRLSAAYVMSKMSPYLVGDPRPVRLLAALYDAL